MTMIYVVILLSIILAISIYIVHKIEEDELRLRMSDKKLNEYYYESITERNDGWTKLHYKNLYKNRLKFLKK